MSIQALTPRKESINDVISRGKNEKVGGDPRELIQLHQALAAIRDEVNDITLR